jgi:hypothetical protein
MLRYILFSATPIGTNTFYKLGSAIHNFERLTNSFTFYHSWATVNRNLMLTMNSFSKLNGVKSKAMTAGKNLTALSVNILKMTSVRCQSNLNVFKTLTVR